MHIGNNIPAPNAYKTRTLMGTIYNSKFRSGHLISMSPKFKYKDTREKYPGPGTYIRFSEFGILVGKSSKKVRENHKNGGKYKVSKTEANENIRTNKPEIKVLETE